MVITGANQGGKSTFLRALGLAQLMMQCGLFVVAEECSAGAVEGIQTHFRREEDPSMVSGKFDEELARMSAIVDRIGPRWLILCNESFSSTNERDASRVGGDIIEGLLASGIRVHLVTHHFELAQRLRRDVAGATFLRAARLEDGTRSYEIVQGEPLRTSYGMDVYAEVIGGATREPTSGAGQEDADDL
ncbi:MAG: MutS-related protein [Nocardioides sp.]